MASKYVWRVGFIDGWLAAESMTLADLESHATVFASRKAAEAALAACLEKIGGAFPVLVRYKDGRRDSTQWWRP